MEAAHGERVPVPAAAGPGRRIPRVRIQAGAPLPRLRPSGGGPFTALRLPGRFRWRRVVLFRACGSGGVARLGVEESGDPRLEAADHSVVRRARRRLHRRASQGRRALGGVPEDGPCGARRRQLGPRVLRSGLRLRSGLPSLCAALGCGERGIVLRPSQRGARPLPGGLPVAVLAPEDAGPRVRPRVHGSRL